MGIMTMCNFCTTPIISIYALRKIHKKASTRFFLTFKYHCTFLCGFVTNKAVYLITIRTFDFNPALTSNTVNATIRAADF